MSHSGGTGKAESFSQRDSYWAEADYVFLKIALVQILLSGLEQNDS